MASLNDLTFFATHPHTCSYLPEQDATTLFLDPSQTLDEALYAQLSSSGFRRSGEHLYRPHCQHCSACVPTRLPVADLTLTRQQRKVVNRNADLQVTRQPAQMTDEYYALYARYIETRHRDGDMYPPSREQFQSFLVSHYSFSVFYEFRLQERLVAVAVTDVLSNGLSAVYTFYDPDEERRSLGRFAILWQAREALRLGLPAVYLGYWVKNCRKMNYKTEYRPIEMLVNHNWVRVN